MTTSTLVPSALMRASMASPAPLATDTITITEATPMITPSMARKLLSAFTLSAASADLEGGERVHDASSTICAVAEREPPLRAPGDVGLVGDDDHGDAGLVQLLEQLDDLLGGAAVERAGRLVGEDDMRVVDQRAGDRHALLLPARKLRRLVVLAMGEPDLGEARLGLLARAGMPVPRIEEGERHIVEGARPRQQVEGLEDEADLLVAVGGELVGAEPAELAALDFERAAGRRVERADQIHEGRFARARGAGHREILAARHLDADALQSADDAAAESIGLDQVVGGDLRHVHAHGVPSRTRTTTSAPSGRPSTTSVAFWSARPSRTSRGTSAPSS